MIHKLKTYVMWVINYVFRREVLAQEVFDIVLRNYDEGYHPRRHARGMCSLLRDAYQCGIITASQRAVALGEIHKYLDTSVRGTGCMLYASLREAGYMSDEKSWEWVYKNWSSRPYLYGSRPNKYHPLYPQNNTGSKYL